jgi:hypothetical protein
VDLEVLSNQEAQALWALFQAPVGQMVIIPHPLVPASQRLALLHMEADLTRH